MASERDEVNCSSSRGKALNWGYHETKLLISVWAEEDIQRQLSSMGRKRIIWQSLAAKLQENGYERSGEQCKTRMHNLKQKYKKVKLLNNTSGQGKSTCAFFDELDEVLGHKPSISPLATLDSSAADYIHTEEGNSVLDVDFGAASVSEESATEPTDFPILSGGENSSAASTSGSNAATPPVGAQSTKKGKKRKQYPKEKAADKMEGFMEKFFDLQQESEKRFLESEERRARLEAEQEEKRRKYEAEQDEKREQFMLTVLQTLTKAIGGSSNN